EFFSSLLTCNNYTTGGMVFYLPECLEFFLINCILLKRLLAKTIAMNLSPDPYILPLNKVGINDIDKVGGKNASLGEMLQNLSSLGINIPNGFVITVSAYRKFLEENKLEEQIRGIIDKIDYDNIESLRRGGLQV